MPRRRGRAALVAAAMLSVCALGAVTAPAFAAQQWSDGLLVSASQVKCITNLQQNLTTMTKAGYLTDSAKPPKAGEVFYGRALFVATATQACGDLDQQAELEVVLPPGVSMAIDSTHPIECFYTDGDNGPQIKAPTCPTRTTTGANGLKIAADDAGSLWTLPAGREFEVHFPLKSDRKLAGAAGGHCPTSVAEIPTSSQRDCLLLALHVIDGYADPWLTPSVDLLVDAADTTTTTGSGTTTTGSGTTTPTKTTTTTTTTPVSRLAFSGAHLAKLATKGLSLSVKCTKACKGTAKVTVTAATAKKLHLGSRAFTLTSGRFSVSAGKTSTVHLKVSKTLARKVAKLKSLPVTVTATPSGAKAKTTKLTLRR